MLFSVASICSFFRKPLVAILSVFILLWGLFFASNTWAQFSQPARYEKEQKSNYRDFTVISMGEQGIALIRDIQRYEHGEILWEVIRVDSVLNESWNRSLPIENRFNLIGHEYRDKTLYFLFREGDAEQGKLKIVKVDVLTGQTEEHSYEPELAIRLTHFNVVADQVILAGYVSNQPTVLLYNLMSHQAKIVPGLLVNDSELLDVRVNINNTFNVLVTERQSKAKKRIIAKTFDQVGALLLDDVVEYDPNKSILTGFTSTLIRDELMIMGTWGEGVSKQASGIYTLLVDPYSEQAINFYDFAQLNHFMDYLSPKRAAKTKLKSEIKRKSGKIPEYKVSVLPARLDETKEGFLFFVEAYYSASVANTNRWASNPYGQYPYSPYSYNPYRIYNTPYSYGYPYTFGNNSSIPETKMLQSSLSVFNAKGELQADHGLKLEDLKLTSPEQVSDFYHTDTKCYIGFCKEDKLNVQLTQRDGVELESKKENLQLKSTIETIRGDRDDITATRYWFSNFLFVYGYHTVKNAEKGNRDVFFINKLKID